MSCTWWTLFMQYPGLKFRATEDWRQGLSDVVRHWVCVISRPYYFREEVCPGVEMKSTKLVLLTYKAETVRPLGEAHMKVEYIGSQYTLLFRIVREGTGALFGRNCLTDFNLDWKNLPGLNHIEPLQSRPSVLEKKKVNYYRPNLDVILGNRLY